MHHILHPLPPIPNPQPQRCPADIAPTAPIGYDKSIPMGSASVDVKKTVNLPRTDFPMKANLGADWSRSCSQRWETEDLYAQIRAARAGRPMYVLHDGPPYANGNIHLGTAFNKILKDFIVKLKTMEGFDSPYVPGWDCHGLPIENQGRQRARRARRRR